MSDFRRKRKGSQVVKINEKKGKDSAETESEIILDFR